MTRKEEIQKASYEYCDPFCNPQPTGDLAFRKGAEWADNHPRKGLWDAEEVTKWLENNLEKFGCFNCFIEDHKVEPDIIKSLREAMED